MRKLLPSGGVLASGLLFVLLLVLALQLPSGHTVAAPVYSPESYVSQVPIVVTATTKAVTSADRMHGSIRAVYLDYGSTMTNTTDLTITTLSPAATVLILTDTYTDGWYYPSVQLTGSTGAAVSGAYKSFPIEDQLVFTLTQSSAGTLNAYVYWGDN